jgi:hypothetical protein
MSAVAATFTERPRLRLAVVIRKGRGSSNMRNINTKSN